MTQIEAFLRDRGAGRMPHPGGTLLEHLGRVQRLLIEWGADPAVQLAGLCHASYGTDGFAPALLPVTERATLTELIGERAEALVHLYASCDRATVYPLVNGTWPVPFRNRFTGDRHIPPPAHLRAFLEITTANDPHTAQDLRNSATLRTVQLPLFNSFPSAETRC